LFDGRRACVADSVPWAIQSMLADSIKSA
jgi:hypothetical protein